MTTCTGPQPLTEDELFAIIDKEAASAVQYHLSECPYCQQRLERLRAFDDGMFSALGWGAQTRAAFRDATAPWFRERPVPPPEARPSLWERAAGLVRQLLPQPMAIVGGLKGNDDGNVQRLSARVEHITLVLEAFPAQTSGQVRLKGMVLDEADAEADDDNAPFRWAGSLVELVQRDVPEHLTMMDEQAEFEIDPLNVGTWNVNITAEWGEVLQLQGIELK